MKIQKKILGGRGEGRGGGRVGGGGGGPGGLHCHFCPGTSNPQHFPCNVLQGQCKRHSIVARLFPGYK